MQRPHRPLVVEGWNSDSSGGMLPSAADVVESVDTRDLINDLSAPGETPGVELLKFGER